MTHLRNEQGFTLMESLLVLAIFMMILTISYFPLKFHEQLLEKQMFFHQLKGDLLYAQQYALTSQKRVSFNFVTPQHYYYIKNDNHQTILRREYPPYIRIAAGSQPTAFYFLSNGNISQFGTLYIYVEKEIYQLTFQLGRGRFYVKKL